MTAIRQYLNLWRAANSDSFPERYKARGLIIAIHTLVILALVEVLVLIMVAV